jgi:hypothetical protein
MKVRKVIEVAHPGVGHSSDYERRRFGRQRTRIS